MATVQANLGREAASTGAQRPEASTGGAAAQRPGTPLLDNMGVPNHLAGQGSEDTAVLTLYVEWDRRWESLRALLKSAQAAAQEGEVEASFMTCGGYTLQVAASGRRVGGTYRAFRFECCGCEFELSNSEGPRGDWANAQVTIGSLCCMELGLESAWLTVQGVIRALGGKLVAHKLSRVDMAIDIPDLGVGCFVDASLDGHLVTRAVDRAYYGKGRNLSSVRIGKETLCRIYCKATELRDKPDARKLQFMVNQRWGGKYCSQAARVEFQLRRPFLRSIVGGVDTVEDWLERRAEIMRYLTTEWLRFVEVPEGEDYEPRYSERYDVAAFWSQVQETFAAVCDWKGGCIRRERKETVPEGEQLRAQAAGCLISLAALFQEKIENASQLYAAAMDEMKQWFFSQDGLELCKKWFSRRAAIVAHRQRTSRRNIHQDAGPYSFNLWLREAEHREERMRTEGGQRRLFDDGTSFDVALDNSLCWGS